MSKYSKTIIAVAGVVVAYLAQRYGSGSQGVRLLIELLAALGVYTVPNKPTI